MRNLFSAIASFFGFKGSGASVPETTQKPKITPHQPKNVKPVSKKTEAVKQTATSHATSPTKPASSESDKVKAHSAKK
jgi:hypothetical protein